MTDDRTTTADELTDRLWRDYGQITVQEIPDAALEVAAQCVLDWFGCAVAGSQEPLTVILTEELATGTGPATLVGPPGELATTGMLQAAMINGAAGHALDFDDTNIVMGGHPTVPVLPALLALAETVGASGAQVLSAFVVGLEVESRLGDMIGGDHYAKGWHKTSTIGVFGAAAAACHVLGLDEVQFGHAMGLAASNAAGVKANFGTMTKPYHAGHAAERGLLAARLAARGFTANPEAVGGNQSLAQAAGEGALRLGRLQTMADRWLTTDTLFKYHAACYLTHAGIEATSAIMDEQRLTAAEVDQITLVVHPSLDDVCNIQFPTTGLEAKFSLRATQAFAVNGVDTTSVEAYEDGPVNKPEVQKFIDKVTVEFDESLATTATRATVTNLAAQRHKLEAKFNGLAGPVLGGDHVTAVVDRLRGFADLADDSVGAILRW